MRYIFILFIFITCSSLLSCSESGVANDGTTNTVLLVLLILFLVAWAWTKREEVKKEQNEKIESESSYHKDFIGSLNSNGIVATNAFTHGQQYGFAVADDLKSLAFYSTDKQLKIHSSDQIIACDIHINYREHIASKSKAPIVTLNTVARTSSQVIKEFTSADLLITIHDISNPVLKLNLSSLQNAEKYNALIKLMISNKKSIIA